MADPRHPRRPSSRRPPKPPPKERKNTMSELKPSADSVFEVGRIRRLVELMKEHDLSEVDLRESRQRIRICRGPKEGPRMAYGPPPPPPPPAPAVAGSASAAKAAPADAANIAVIKSPMVGTFYA